MNEPMMGCSGCATTAGRMACPVHGRQATAPVPMTYYSTWPPTGDMADLKRDLRRIIELLEMIARVRR